MRILLLAAMGSACLSAMDVNNNNAHATSSYSDVVCQYCCSLVIENIFTRYAAAERQALLNSAHVQEAPPNIEARTYRACCARHWGKICCCGTCCCISVGGGAIAFAGGITQGIEAIKNAKVGISRVMQ